MEHTGGGGETAARAAFINLQSNQHSDLISATAASTTWDENSTPTGLPAPHAGGSRIPGGLRSFWPPEEPVAATEMPRGPRRRRRPGRRRRSTRPPRPKPVPGDEIPNARRRGRWCRRRRSSERYFPGGGPWDRVRRARVGPGPVWGHRGPTPRRPRPPGSSKSALLSEPVRRVRFNYKYCLVGVKKHPAGAFEGSRRVYWCCGELF